MRILRNLVPALVALSLLTACSGPGGAPRSPYSKVNRSNPAISVRVADLVLTNGNIVTVDRQHGTVQALAAKDGRILGVGSNLAIQKFIGPDTLVLDLEGKLAVPGFIEGHAHFLGLGDAKTILDLSKVQSWSEVIGMVADAVNNAQPGEWIRGRGWHQEKWDTPPPDTVEGFPTHDSLSAVSPDNPVSLTHASGHAAFFNAKAMAVAGVTKETANPAGGEILKDKEGFPIGVFRETAASLVGRFQRTSEMARGRTAAQTMARKVDLAVQECLSKGVTSFQDAGSSFRDVDLLKKMADDGRLGVRLWVMIRSSNPRLKKSLRDYRMIDYADHHLTVRAVKRTIDGALGSRGAWLLEPYSDSPNSTGLATAGSTAEAAVRSVTETAELALDAGFQVCVHAIGDRANREVLDLFGRVLGGRKDGKLLRWRIEHAQHLHPDDIPRFAQMGIIASMQGVHCTSDAPYVEPRLGAQRAKAGAYVWQSLIRSGAVVTNGTDAPVEDVDPIASFYASVTRRDRTGKPFYPDQRMTRMQALESYTIKAAFSAFEDKQKGSLTPGKLADVVVLSKDIMTVPEEEIIEAEVVHTIVGGKIVYSAK